MIASHGAAASDRFTVTFTNRGNVPVSVQRSTHTFKRASK
jgi:hypothetical protein